MALCLEFVYCYELMSVKFMPNRPRGDVLQINEVIDTLGNLSAKVFSPLYSVMNSNYLKNFSNY